MNFSIQTPIETANIQLFPLSSSDFETLYAVASDPKIWEQHPNKDRWKKEVFQVFFDGAIKSQGAFKIVDKQSQDIIGSTRFYDYNQAENSIFIGYTFYGTAAWGKGINTAVKQAMLQYIFQYVDKVLFHIGSKNIRSQIATERLGAVKIGEEEVAYFGEASQLNFVYEINKTEKR